MDGIIKIKRKGFRKGFVRGIMNFLKNEKKRLQYMNVLKIYLKRKNKSSLSMEKIILKCAKNRLGNFFSRQICKTFFKDFSNFFVNCAKWLHEIKNIFEFFYLIPQSDSIKFKTFLNFFFYRLALEVKKSKI